MTNPRKFSRRDVVLGGAALAGIGVIAACDAQSPTSAPPSSPAETSTTIAASTTTVTEASSSVQPVESSSTSTVHTGPARFVDRGPTTTNQVALTFHASGAKALCVALLDVLRDHATPVTVFAVGTWITANPELGRRIVDEGHELGNHTLTHPSLGTLTRAKVREEIVGGGAALVPFLGSVGPWFRPSGIQIPTDVILDEAGRAGYERSIGYSVDSLDFTDPGAAAVIANVNTQVKAGDVISMHFGHQGTIDALPAILRHLAASGLEPVGLGTLLAGA